MIFRNIGLRGGVSPARRYIPELLDDVLDGRINPGRVFDYETDLDGIARGVRGDGRAPRDQVADRVGRSDADCAHQRGSQCLQPNVRSSS